ncbi:hypothetical protein Tco_0759292 [Tanacetum coccineum]
MTEVMVVGGVAVMVWCGGRGDVVDGGGGGGRQLTQVVEEVGWRDGGGDDDGEVVRGVKMVVWLQWWRWVRRSLAGGGGWSPKAAPDIYVCMARVINEWETLVVMYL